MIQLIVNADDFGLTQAVNVGIADAHWRGIVTSTTIMANGEAFDAAVAISQRAPKLGIGVHLNLTSGPPVSRAARVPSLVDRNGQLYLSPGRLLRALLARSVKLAEVEAELRAQIGKVLRAGIQPTHLDGHKHLHVLPGVAQIVVRLAQEFSIRSVRCPRELVPSSSTRFRLGGPRSAVLKQFLVARAVTGFARRFEKVLAKAGLLFPAYFFGLSQTGFLRVGGVIDILESLPEGVSELMCHPGYLDRHLVDAGTRLLEQREVELKALTAPVVNTIVAHRGIELITYDQLGTRVQKTALRPERVPPECAQRNGRALAQGGLS